MIRPCFLVVDRQYPGSISARKLVIETAQMNVITAYSAEEAIQTLSRFPAVDGVVLDTEVRGLPCRELIARLRSICGDIPVITVSPSGYERCGEEDYHLSGYDPQSLLELLRELCSKKIRQAEQPMEDPDRSGTPE